MKQVQIKEIVRGIVREEFKKSLSEGIPKLFLKIEAVKKEIDRLTAERKSKFGGEYARKLNAETDPKKREQLKQPILAISKKITALQKNLLDLYDMEERYIQNLDKDVELNLSEMSQNDVHFKDILRMYDHGGSFSKKKVAVVVCKNPKASRKDIIDAMLDMDYSEITDVQDELGIKESVEGDRIQNLNNRIKALRDKISATKSPEQKNKFQNTLKNALQSLSNIRKKQSESVNEEASSEETLKGLKEMAIGDLERIADYAEMIFDRMEEGQELESWMYSQITLAVDQLNSVHDAMDGIDGVKESINEAKYDTYHKTYTSAIQAGLDWAKKSGYDYDEEEAAREIGMGPRKPSEGKTNKFHLSLRKDFKPQKKMLHIQVYGMKNSYELNAYIG